MYMNLGKHFNRLMNLCKLLSQWASSLPGKLNGTNGDVELGRIKNALKELQTNNNNI